jgi:hypothetical protein
MRVKLTSDGNPARTKVTDEVGNKISRITELTLKVDVTGSTLRFIQNGYKSPVLAGRQTEDGWVFED